MIVLIAFAKTMTNTWSGFKSTSEISTNEVTSDGISSDVGSSKVGSSDVGSSKEITTNEVTSKEITPKELITNPIWLDQAMQYAQIAASLSSSEIADLLKVNPKIAAETVEKFDLIVNGESELLPSLAAYTGAVFRQMNVNDWNIDDWKYAQNCIRIPSCIYGMLRPLDRISPYRMEGNVKLSKFSNHKNSLYNNTLAKGFSENKTVEKTTKQNLLEEQNLFQEWRDKLTPVLIEDIKAQDGILVNLASEEMKKFFNWSDLKKESTECYKSTVSNKEVLNKETPNKEDSNKEDSNKEDSTIIIVKPDFYQLKEDGSLKSVTMYAKMCRGAMVKYIIKNRINKIDDLKKFTWEGFEFSPAHSTEEHLIFVRH